jgi:hypothetical protein
MTATSRRPMSSTNGVMLSSRIGGNVFRVSSAALRPSSTSCAGV